MSLNWGGKVDNTIWRRTMRTMLIKIPKTCVSCNKEPRATPEQVRYIEILAGDLGLDRIRRNFMCSRIVEHEVKFLDELTLGEASKVIDEMLVQKENK